MPKSCDCCGAGSIARRHCPDGARRQVDGRRSAWQGGGSQESSGAERRGARKDAGRKTPRASASERTRAAPAVQIDQLPAVADQPVVIERQDDRDATARGLLGDSSGQTGEMLHVDDIGLPVVQDVACDPLNGRIRVARLERDGGLERVVDGSHAHRTVRRPAHAQLRPVRVLFTRQDHHFVRA